MVACFPNVETVEVKRPGESITDLHVFRKSLPRNGGNDLFLECPSCHGLRRALYGWKAGGATSRRVFRAQWNAVSVLDSVMRRRAVHFWSDHAAF